MGVQEGVGVVVAEALTVALTLSLGLTVRVPKTCQEGEALNEGVPDPQSLRLRLRMALGEGVPLGARVAVPQPVMLGLPEELRVALLQAEGRGEREKDRLGLALALGEEVADRQRDTLCVPVAAGEVEMDMVPEMHCEVVTERVPLLLTVGRPRLRVGAGLLGVPLPDRV